MRHILFFFTTLFACLSALNLQAQTTQPNTLNKGITVVSPSDSTASTTPVDEITLEEYVETYRTIAILEMKRTGIPASVTLAQGIIESKYGNSRLARKANNHFGVKCRSDWHGGRAYKSDEEANECFRRYQTPIQSFVDHSTFLAANQRYAFLFLLDLLDYRGWANGLEELGYSTSGHYAEKLTAIIETHNLYVYDMAGSKLDTLHLDIPEPAAYYKKYVQRAYTKKAHNLEEAKFAGRVAMDKLHEFHRFDGAGGYEYIPKDDRAMNMEQIAESFGGDSTMTQLYKEAESQIIPLLENAAPPDDTQLVPIYNEPEKSSANGLTMTSSKQDSLLMDTASVLSTAKQPNAVTNPDTSPLSLTADSIIISPQQGAKNKTIPIKYTVQPGDSLYGIAQRFGVSITEIQQTNHLAPNSLPAGKELVIEIK